MGGGRRVGGLERCLSRSGASYSAEAGPPASSFCSLFDIDVFWLCFCFILRLACFLFRSMSYSRRVKRIMV